MAVFEKVFQRKVCIDDTQALRCWIVNTQNIQGHTEYVIKVERSCNNDKSWKVYKRYNDFVALHQQLLPSSINLPLPPKKYLNNFDREFIAERQIGLQKYLNVILMNAILASSFHVRRFLDPQNYTISYQELALQYVSIALRSDVEYQIVKPVPEIGWRIRKHYFQVKKSSSNNSKDEYILSWCQYGPDKYISDKDMFAVFKSLTSLQHPNIATIESLCSTDGGAYVIRKFRTEGSLRDIIFHCKPKLPFLKKYANPKQSSALPIQQVALYCSQILQALMFLKDKGIPYGNLHASNIVIENNSVKLLDIENGVLGVPSYYRPYFIQYRKVSTLEAVDVYCFGHVLYEMLFGYQLQQAVCDNIPDCCPTQFRPVLELILSSNACKTGLPTLESLANMSVFSSVHHNLPERPHIKMTAHVKELFREAYEKTLSRLDDEQRTIRHQKRLVKMQAVLSAEGEKKFEKKKNKIRLNGQKSHSLDHTSDIANGYYVGNHGANNNLVNGISPERSDSPNSTSTATSAGTLTPPTVIPPPPMMPVKPFSPADSIDGDLSANEKRNALLGSICQFDKSKLRRTNQST